MKRCCLLIVLFTVLSLPAQRLEVKVEGVRSETGQLCFALFADEESFKDEIPFWKKYYLKADLISSNYEIIIDIPEGCYGLSVLDDENMNCEMNYRLLKIPKEGFGFSNYYHKGLQRPAFKSFSFNIEKNQTLPITVIMKYL